MAKDFVFKSVVTPDGGAPAFTSVGNINVPAGQELKITDFWGSVPGGAVVQTQIAAAVDWEYRVPTGGATTSGQAALTFEKPYVVDGGGGGVTVDVLVSQIDGTWSANGFVALTGCIGPKGE